MEIERVELKNEDSRDLELLNTKMYMYKILYSALKKVIKTNSFERCLKKKLMFLINPLNQEDMFELEKVSNDQLGISSDQLSCNIGQPEEKEYLLGLSSDIMSQLNTIHFTQSEILLIRDIYFKELPKFLKELSESVIEFRSAPALPDCSSGIQTFDKSCELAKSIHNLVLDNNSEIENNVQLQNNLIKLKYKTIPGNELKEIKNYEEKKLKETLQLANNLQEETLNIIYPTEDCSVKMKEEVCSLKQELIEVNKTIEELSLKKEMYQEVDMKEMMIIVEQYKEIKRKRKMVEMTIGEIKPFYQ